MVIHIGIDWSEAKHDLCFMNEAGAAVAQLTIPHSPEGFLKLDAVRAQLGVTAAECRVGLPRPALRASGVAGETAHNLLIDSPMACGRRATSKCTSFHLPW